MCVCVCVRARACVYTPRLYTCTYIYKHMHVHVYPYMYTNICMPTRVCLFTHIYQYFYMYPSVSTLAKHQFSLMSPALIHCHRTLLLLFFPQREKVLCTCAGGGAEGERESPAGSVLSVELEAGLDLMTLRP